MGEDTLIISSSICKYVQQMIEQKFKALENKKAAEKQRLNYFGGGAEGDRTPDLTAASRTLSQLSYSPTKSG